MLKTLAVSSFVLLLLCSEAGAVCSSFPNTLTNGTTADASQVMANLNCAALTSGATIDTVTLTGTTSLPGSGAITSAGNVGIGTSSPAFNLVVSSGSSPRAFIASTGTGFAVFQADSNSGTGNVVIGIESSTGNVIQNNDTPYGAVIGSPTGGIEFGGGSGNATHMRLTAAGVLSCTSGCTNSLSDKRLKTNIKELSEVDGLAVINTLKPVSFNWRSVDLPAVTQYGFIAQEVQKSLPDLVGSFGTTTIVHTDGALQQIPDTLNLNYDEFIPILTKGIQEQQVEINALKIANGELTAKIHSLDAKLSSLERRMSQRSARVAPISELNSVR